MSIKCKACGASMDMTEIPNSGGELETLCSTCMGKHDSALRVDQWDFEGLFWDAAWGDGKQAWENLNERIKATQLESDTASQPTA